MALWFVSYAMSPITVTIYDVSIVIVYDVALLLSMTYHFQSRLGKTDCTDIWVIKLKHQVSPSIGFRVPHCEQSETNRNDDNAICDNLSEYLRKCFRLYEDSSRPFLYILQTLCEQSKIAEDGYTTK